MSSGQALAIMWEEGKSVFTNTSYSLFNIEAHLVSIIVLVILLSKRQSSSDQTETQIAYSRMLFVQILYCLSGIFRVLVDISVIPKSNTSQYIVTALNFSFFGCLCWLTFMYIELYQKSTLLKSTKNKIISAIPFIFNVLMLALTPWTGLFIDISGTSMQNGILFPLMFSIDLGYPTIAIIIALSRRNKMGKYERDNLSMMSIYPAFFLICGPLQALNWRIPFLCYAIMISDIFVYINYADSLVSIDPMTKIANKNGLIRTLSDRLKQNNKEDLENMYLFAVDIEDLGIINSTYGRSEGDRALMVVARALKKFRDEEHKCYISRYFSDEFILIADIKDNEELDLFVEHIRNYISNTVTSSKLQYLIKVSIGYAKYEPYSKTETVSGLIEEADRLLNENKEQRRFQNMWRRNRPGLQNL